jgi:ribonuclease VapC
VALMVIDTSAMIACLFDEPERISFIDAIDGAKAKLISVVSFVEASFVILGKKGEDGIADLARFIGRARIENVPVDADQAELAVEAFRRFGKGRHPARLNIGDCFAYALARSDGPAALVQRRRFRAHRYRRRVTKASSFKRRRV